MPKGGCFGENEWIYGEITDRCPVMYIHEFTDVFLAFNHYQQGYLPHSGGWADQPALLMHYMSIVTSEKIKNDERLAKRGN